jgi:hypothetical protein
LNGKHVILLAECVAFSEGKTRISILHGVMDAINIVTEVKWQGVNKTCFEELLYTIQTFQTWFS